MNAPSPVTRGDGIPVWKELGATPFEGPAEQETAVLIVGAGPIGLAMALDLARRGIDLILISRLDFIAAGSKAICWSKRTLDICDRLGVGQRLVDKGVTWNVGKVFWSDRDEPVYQFDMLPVKHQRRPAFINLQQYYVEEYLLDELRAYSNVDLRFGHELLNIQTAEHSSKVRVRCGDSEYTITASFLVACDGHRSTVRDQLGLDFEGRVFEENFLIADVRMSDERPSERWFWFDPPFNPGKSALLHKQPDDVWRLDFQLGWDVDREAACLPENVEPYIRAMLGPDTEFSEEWYSVYTFQCRRMKNFVHDRVVFAGDSAHLVSPFGARGGNGGFADIDNLGWKLERILNEEAPLSLLESYDYEATLTADENILNSTRSTDFLTPKSKTSLAFRDAVLELAGEFEFARPLVNSGRLSTASAYPDSPLNTPDGDSWTAGPPPGSPPMDAPIGDGWLLEELGDEFILMTFGADDPRVPGLRVLDLSSRSYDWRLIHRYGLEPGSAYLFRPDQYVAARWKNVHAAGVAQAMETATGKRQENPYD